MQGFVVWTLLPPHRAEPLARQVTLSRGTPAIALRTMLLARMGVVDDYRLIVDLEL